MVSLPNGGPPCQLDDRNLSTPKGALRSKPKSGTFSTPIDRDPACRAPVAAASNARPRTTDPGPTDPSRSTRGSSADSPRSVATTPPSRPPAPGSASAASSSPIGASASRPLAVDVANSVERMDALDNRQGVTFSAATNGKPTVATNSVTRAAATTVRRSAMSAPVRGVRVCRPPSAHCQQVVREIGVSKEGYSTPSPEHSVWHCVCWLSYLWSYRTLPLRPRRVTRVRKRASSAYLLLERTGPLADSVLSPPFACDERADLPALPWMVGSVPRAQGAFQPTGVTIRETRTGGTNLCAVHFS